MMDFRKLSEEEKKDSRKWARDNYKPFSYISDLWHPVVRDECRKINAEKGILLIGGVADGEWKNIPQGQESVNIINGDGHDFYEKQSIEIQNPTGHTWRFNFFVYGNMPPAEAIKRLLSYYSPFNEKDWII